MENNLQVGIELLFLGMLTVFAVLVILMAVMYLLAILVKRGTAPMTAGEEQVSLEEIAAISAVMTRVMPDQTIKAIKTLNP